jgi:hypothetical protein
MGQCFSSSSAADKVPDKQLGKGSKPQEAHLLVKPSIPAAAKTYAVRNSMDLTISPETLLQQVERDLKQSKKIHFEHLYKVRLGSALQAGQTSSPSSAAVGSSGGPRRHACQRTRNMRRCDCGAHSIRRCTGHEGPGQGYLRQGTIRMGTAHSRFQGPCIMRFVCPQCI